MSHRKTVLWLVVVAVIALSTFIAVRTFVNSGPSAVTAMNPDERAIMTNTELLRRGMTKEQVVAILRAPDEEGALGLRPKWCVGNCGLNASRAQKVLWINVGRFVYERAL